MNSSNNVDIHPGFGWTFAIVVVVILMLGDCHAQHKVTENSTDVSHQVNVLTPEGQRGLSP